MTRINCGVHPAELPRLALIAEHREILRIPSAVAKDRLSTTDIPLTFRLGKGHVKFFADKLGYLKRRYCELRDEGLRRGYNMNDWSSVFSGYPSQLAGDYRPTWKDRLLTIDRLVDRNHMLIPTAFPNGNFTIPF